MEQIQLNDSRSAKGNKPLLIQPQKKSPLTPPQVEFLALAKEIRIIATQIHLAAQVLYHATIELRRAAEKPHQARISGDE